MNCPYCNSPLRPGILFCTECGKKLPQKRECPHCGKAYESVTTICPFCGRDSEAPVGKPAPVVQKNTVATTPQSPVTTEQQKKTNKKWLFLIAAAVIVGTVYGVFTFLGDDDSKGASFSSDGIVSSSSSSNSEYESSSLSTSNSNSEYNSSSSSNQSNNDDNNNSNNYTPTEFWTLIGSIDGKYPITMDLEQDGGSLRGSYYYNRNGPDQSLNVYGKIDGSRFRLQEYDNDNNNTGNFVGTYHNGEVTGTFSLPNGKTMSFDLAVVNVNYSD